MDEFLGRSSTFWTGVSALAACTSTAFFVFSIWFIYRQLKTAAKAFQFDANQRLQELVDKFREDRHDLFTTLPLELALTNDQFANRPPTRHRSRSLTDDELQRMALTGAQSAAFKEIEPKQRECAMRVIARLNDIGQLVEDRFIDRTVFLGKYHVMIIQCCHMVEAIRRDEEARRGGNYGQRLLRMRRSATIYNDVWPKHRVVAIDICKRAESIHRSASPIILRRVIYKTPASTIRRRLIWRIRGLLSWY